MKRRKILKSIFIGTTILSTLPLFGNKKKVRNIRIVVCGGGFGGLTVAKYLKIFNPDLEVILIEQNSQFISCPYSNVWLGEADNITLKDLTFDYQEAANKFKYDFINETIVGIDRDKQLVQTNINQYNYDYLVLSPGVDYDYTSIFKNTKIAKQVYNLYPPAMKPGKEHIILKEKLENFQGGTFILNVPSGTYRCPPAPYERACMIAYYLKQNNIDGKVILLDPREKPGAKPKGFLDTFKTLYKDYIVYMPQSEIKDINLDAKYLIVDKFDISTVDYIETKVYFDDANIIPNMKPAQLIFKANIQLTKKGWAALKSPTFESISDNRVIVIGDSGGHPYPKSGHMANSSGYVAAKHLAYKTLNKKFDISKELPSNVCYSLVNGNPKEGISVHHTVSYSTKKGLKVKAKSTLKRDIDTGNIIKEWYKAITTDLFG